MKVLTHLNLNKNELQNAIFQNLATAPSAPFVGQFYYDTVEHMLKIWNGTSWSTAGSSYLLPAATNEVRGGIRIGSGLSLGSGADADLLSANTQSDNNFTNAYKTKLDGIAAGAEVNVQSDWNQTTNTADDYIKNKPTLATVATSGSYTDLTGKPNAAAIGYSSVDDSIIETATNVQDALHQLDNGTYQLINQGLSGKQDTLVSATNIKTINSTSLLGSGDIVINEFSDEKAQDAVGAMVTGNTETGITVTYDDASAKLNFVVASQTDNNFTNTLKTKLDGIAAGAEVNVNADWNASSGDAQILNKPTLATVATTGSYNDLSNKPDLSLKADLVNGLIPASQLPSYVDDVIELLSISSGEPVGSEGAKYFDVDDNKIYTYSGSSWGNPTDPEQGKIYVDLANDITYRWSGTALIDITNPMDIASQTEAEAGTNNTKAMTPLRVAQHWATHKYTVTIGDGEATSYVITHNLGTRDISISIQETSNPYEMVFTTVELTTTNSITVKFTAAPAVGAYKVTIIG